MKMKTTKMVRQRIYKFPVYATADNGDLWIFDSETHATKIDHETGRGSLITLTRGENIDNAERLDVLLPGDKITLTQE